MNERWHIEHVSAPTKISIDAGLLSGKLTYPGWLEQQQCPIQIAISMIGNIRGIRRSNTVFQWKINKKTKNAILTPNSAGINLISLVAMVTIP